ncbi:DUF523 domain-containing protein [Endozoicomonas euniceicola]|uniref:DUF523 domain-containing protein n=1 Tax=Endozoicomonas euniceicola TaxID=1234143 RepID=A0ABY6GUX9_9GAMM|nr:DUF523 domain-containing protein [Endozoicomonas euniceicola]UYM16578.1 DUF523 domain-containing protein [Endozoicomonas euniceicola]
MEKVLVSSCLLGNKVRYNGLDLSCENELIKKWLHEGRVVAFCPEVSAGLPTPRAPAEIQNGNGEDVLQLNARVVENTGEDVSEQFIAGAELALKLCIKHKIQVAILTESSPSCGSTMIYNGDFSDTKKAGQGVTAALLSKHGIRVFSQNNINEAATLLTSHERTRS